MASKGVGERLEIQIGENMKELRYCGMHRIGDIMASKGVGERLEIQIGENMKELRRGLGVTQEQLASYLGVTSQAISKWERGECYPDISLLPMIAVYFNVSVDDLLGISKTHRTERIRYYQNKDALLRREGETSQIVSLWRSAQKEFPDETEVLHMLTFALRAEDLAGNADEIIAISEEIISKTDRSGEYFGAINNICYAFAAKNDISQAKKYAKMAGRYAGTENQLMIHILEGEDAVQFCKWNIETLVDLISTNCSVMLKKSNISADIRIEICRNMIELFQLVYGKNMGFYHCRISSWNMKMAEICLREQLFDQALEHIRTAYMHANKFDLLTEGKYNSPLMDGLAYQIPDTVPETVTQLKLKLRDKLYDPIRNRIDWIA